MSPIVYRIGALSAQLFVTVPVGTNRRFACLALRSSARQLPVRSRCRLSRAYRLLNSLNSDALAGSGDFTLDSHSVGAVDC